MPDNTNEPNRFILDLPPMPQVEKGDLVERITTAVAAELQLGRHQVSVKDAGSLSFEDLRADLAHRRRAHAEDLYVRHEFGSTAVEATDWNISEDGVTWSRQVTLTNRPKGSAVWFSVRFGPDSSEPIAAWDNLGHGTALDDQL